MARSGPSRPEKGPRKKPTATARMKERLVEIERDIERYDVLVKVGARLGQGGAAVAAAGKRTACERERASLRLTMAAATERDPVRALEILRDAASAEGSWIAATQLGKLVEEERVKAAAAAAAAKDAAKRDPDWALKATVASLKRMPEAMQERWLGALLEAALPAARRRAIMPFALGAAVDEARERKQQA